MALTAAAAVLLAELPARAEPQPRVSAVLSRNSAPYRRALEGFKRAWSGPVDTHVLELEPEAAVASRVRSEHPALVVAVGGKAARFAQALGEIPVVYCMVIDPGGSGVGAANVVGVPLEVSPAAQLGMLKKLMPSVRTVGLVYNPSRAGSVLHEAQAAAAKLGLALAAEPAAAVGDFPSALQRVLPRAEALWLAADETVVTQDTFYLMLESANSRRLPLLAFGEEFVRLGALFALAPDFEGAGREAARVAAEIARGKKPAELPPAQPQWHLVVNLATARALELPVPPELLKDGTAVKYDGLSARPAEAPGARGVRPP